jgi:putative nucleotidyltransferase with HDIG domain
MADTYDEIERVVVDTFSQWDVVRVGFSWRKYYLDHTLQVLNLATRMARELDADVEQLRYAAILHDVSKRYDGVVRKDAEGRNVLDGEGFWLNETMPPDRQNWVTQLYDRLELHGAIHHISGAVLTDRILREFGHGDRFIRPVSKIVAGHLKGKVPPEVFDERYREPEVRILYDADTIDPNVGLMAFYRNIQINAGYGLNAGEPGALRTYVAKLPRWMELKESFGAQMLTDRGREICEERLQRCRVLFRQLELELADEAVNRKYGLLGVVEHLFTDPDDPSIRRHAATLRQQWLPERERLLAAENELDHDPSALALERSREFMRLFEGELAGEL